MNIVGLARMTGVYEGTSYDNVSFQCTEPYEAGKGVGVKAKTVKVKYAVLTEIFEKALTDNELASFVGKSADFYFDEYKNVKLIVVQQTQK